MGRAILGRGKLTKEIMQARVAKVEGYRAKGLTVVEAAEKCGYNHTSFFDWKKKLAGVPLRPSKDKLKVKVIEHTAGTLPKKYKKREVVQAPSGGRLTIVMGRVDELSAFFRSVGV